MKKKILAVFLSLCMAMSLLPVTALATDAADEKTPSTQAATKLPEAVNGVTILNSTVGSTTGNGITIIGSTVGDTPTTELGGKVALVNGKGYATLQAAVDAVTTDEETTVTLLCGASGNGVQVPSGRNIIFDLGGFTYTIAGDTVGSSGTETNGFQLLRDSNITFKNGTITSTKAKILIQNYSNLTLDGVTLNGAQLEGSAPYTLSNNFGDTVIKDSTIIAGEGGYAFDVYYWPSNGYTDGVSVTVEGNSVIDGDVQYGSDDSKTDEVAKKATLAITSGTFTGTFSTYGLNASKETGINITGGTFSKDVSDYVQPGMKLENGTVVINADTAVAQIGSVGYTTLAAAVAAAEDGDTITMLKEYDATSTITFNADKDVTLDLGGFELTLSRFDLVQGRLTVKNGSVDCDGQAFNVYAGPTATDELYTKLVIEDDVTINADYGICLFPASNSKAGYSSAIEVYGEIERGGIFVSGNLGNDTSTAGNMVSSNKIPTVTIYDSAEVNNGTEGQGIAMNGLANVTVNGGTVSGSEAIGVKRGTLTVNGGTFLSNGKYVNPVEANNNGTEDTGATISITSTYNYAGTINVNLNGGTFTSTNAPAVYQGHSKSGETTKPYTQGVTLNIQGGTFTSPANVATVYVADKADGDAESYTKQVISGGSFKESVAQYVTSDLKYEANANGTYTYHETLDEALDVSNNVSSVEAAKPGATVVTVTVKNGNDVDTIKLTSGTEYSLLDYPDQGYNHFVGWTDQAGKHYDGGDTVTITANTTFTAVWSYIPPANPNYKITIGAMENGTVTADPAAAKAGAEVTLTATPDEGYALGSLTVTDRFGDAVKVTENADGTYTFTMPNGQVTVNATFVETEEPAPTMPFTDVKEGDWFYEEVLYAYENGLMNGVGDNRFAPNTATTRGMLVTILYRLEGEPAVTGEADFDDVGDTWYTDAVIWAAANDIVNGIGDNQFGPENTLTREQLVTMLYRYAQNKGYDVTASADLSGYPDAGQIQSWAQEAMTWSVAEGIVEGMDGNLNPAGSATRAQIATILMRFCEGVAK